MTDKLQTFAEFEKGLKLRSRTLNSGQIAAIFDLLSERFGIQRKSHADGGWIYGDTYFQLPTDPVYFSYSIFQVTNDEVKYSLETNFAESLGSNINNPDLSSLFEEVEGILCRFLDFKHFKTFSTDRPIKFVPAELKEALEIDTDYEFLDVIKLKQQEFNHKIDSL
jgi:hypothetical protein